MIVHTLTGPPAPDLAGALAAFEAAFTYPLGPGQSFRISHGADYPRFFRAMGPAACFVAEREGIVLGTVGVAIRRLLTPDGGERTAAYLGDLKVAPHARRGLTLPRLARAAETWARARADAAFCVVMGGTAVTPATYTGRAGIPRFEEVGRVLVLRLPAREGPRAGDEPFQGEASRAEECFRRLSRGRYACLAGCPDERSETPPAWLRHPEGTACGLLEDTRRAKRLIADDGSEMHSLHLSHFACATPEAGAALLGVTLRRAAGAGVPALFVAIPAADAPALGAALGADEAIHAPATVYASGLVPGPAWNVNTSEV